MVLTMRATMDASKFKQVGVCHGPRCADYGGRALADELMASGISYEILECQSLCPHSPVVRIDGIVKLKAKLDKVLESLI
ncbi:MAG: (2Fe-2S) ferredoxin domain-containing protein [Mariprofundus sp.]|nr:(2Fe-2S) ferredoxin domain-containing protein [Mariprofundus sp.]